MKNNLLCFIIPYFGKLPENFDVFLKTVAENKNFDFLVFTDDKRNFDYPDNVKLHYCSFEELREKFKKKFDFKISLEGPRKLCDFKPTYGYVFEEEIKNYKFWAYCDIDLFLGNLDNFLTESYLEQYDKIFSLGHMTIYRNEKSINRLFMERYNGDDRKSNTYEEIFTNPGNCTFDEWQRPYHNINLLGEQCKIRNCYDWPMFDVFPFSSSFKETGYNGKKREWFSNNEPSFVFVWNKGTLHVYWLEDSKLCNKEILYVHLQKRVLKKAGDFKTNQSFIIYPEKIIAIDGLSDKLIIKYCKKAKMKDVFKMKEKKRRFDELKYVVINKIFKK